MGVSLRSNLFGMSRTVKTRVGFPVDSPPEGAHSPESAPASRFNLQPRSGRSQGLPYDGSDPGPAAVST